MESLLEFGLNIAMVALLSATVLYCWILNRRIQTLQDSRSELAHLLKQFDRSTRRATEAMNTLRKVSKEAGKNVQSRIEKAQYVLDDLSYMIDRANKVADQMEAGIAIARQREKIEVATPTTQQVATQAAPDPVSEAVEALTREEQMIKVTNRPQKTPAEALILEDFQDTEDTIVSGVTRQSIRESLRQAKAGGKDSSVALSSIQSLLETVAERHQADEDIEPSKHQRPSAATIAKGRSRGERELLKALQMQAAE